ncbi:hypothetical protein SLEP1_g53172 [Rubroshorea leprosula]|uniref:Uncharacterized protein n=1 Tax=Rubroshorea leprosula TaxID=152421 RepID=A0AAV5M8M0_9ROSI|nr:hypothetical protein SLEP1_g53172 [Rubroshorea leprosula]
MVSLRELTEQRGNQGREGEEEGVLSVEPITMIVPPELQDVPETTASENSTGSSASDNGDDHRSASSSSSSSEETPSREEGMGDVVSSVSDRPVIGEWESTTIPGRLSNLRKAPKDLPAGFRFRAALHHEVADCTPSISGYKRLEEMVRAYHIPKTILLRTGGIRAGADAANAQQHKVHHRLYAVVRKVGERISNDLAARLSEWRTPNAHINYPQLLPRDVDLKNQLLKYAQGEGLIDLEALVTLEQLAVFGFVDVTNLISEGEMSSILERQRQRAQSSRGRRASSAQPRQTRFDERPPPAPQPRGSSHRGSSSSSRPRADHRAETTAPGARRRTHEETESEEDEVPLARRIRSGGTQPAQAARPTTSASYVRAECQPAMVQAMHSFVPPLDNKRAKAFVQQHGGQVAMIKLMDAFSYAVALYESEQAARTENTGLGAKCKQLATEKASLVDDVNRLQGSEMANRAAATESRADELAAKEETVWVEERAKKAEADRDRTQHELGTLRNKVAEAARNLNAAEEALNELKVTHGRSIAMARAQGAEWLVGSAAFQDAVAVASANVTTEVYNEIRGKLLHHRPDFPIRELVFFDEEELDEQGKSLAPLADTTVRLRWDLNEEGVPVWPPSVLEDGEDPAGLPSFDAWVEGAPVAEQEPSSTPPNSQPAGVSVSSPVSAPASEPAARSPSARSPTAAADASMPVDLTDD